MTKNHSRTVPELELSRYGLTPDTPIVDLEGIVYFNDVATRTVADLEKQLKARYCCNISAEFHHIENEFEREWFAKNYAKIVPDKLLINDIEKREIAELLIKCQTWDQFLATKFPTVKRYGGEGKRRNIPNHLNRLKIINHFQVLRVCWPFSDHSS